MEYFLNMGAFGSVFAVPKAVVDNYIKLANEAAVKVLLYILRNNEQTHDASAVASALNITESQVEEAFVFWENANIFSKSAAAAEIPQTPVTKPQTAETAPTVPEKKTVKPDRREYNINPSEIAERVEQSEEIKCLFTMSEQTFGRPLTHTEQRTFIWIHDYLGLSTEVILMITAFCVSSDKGSIKYIETVAADWAEREVNTLELAQKEIKRLEENASFNGKIMKIFSMDRKPTSKQQAFINSWREKSYSIELIEYAYEKTIDAIDKLNFPYINKILENWYSSGLLTRAQVDNADKASPAANGNKEYSFDLDEYKSLVNNFGD
ncbi:MAG: DnaD domain protein [Porcipelethomonas sp.]